MNKGILGKKVGMTQIFSETGEIIPVTVIEVKNNVVLQTKTVENDGYVAVQLGYEDIRPINPETKKRSLSGKFANLPKMGHVKKANTEPKRYIREFRGMNVENHTVGSELQVDIFASGDLVDVTGVSKGKGFQGVIKRHGQSRGPMAHGSRYHRRPGSMGSIQANRVLKGKRLPGRMGYKCVTVQNLKVIKVDVDKKIMLVSGNVPGAKKGLLKIKSAVKG